MYNFEISNKGWLITHSNENRVRINLNNVSRIQTWISEYDTKISGSGRSYIIAFELLGKVELPKSKGVIDVKNFDQTFWGFDNVFTLIYNREDSWLNAINKIDEYINSK